MRKVNIIALYCVSLMLADTLASGQARNSPTSMAEVAATGGRKMTEIGGDLASLPRPVSHCIS